MLVLKTKRLADLTVLEADSWVVLVTIRMIIGEDRLGFFVALLGYQPAWRFWDPWL